LSLEKATKLVTCYRELRGAVELDYWFSQFVLW